MKVRYYIDPERDQSHIYNHLTQSTAMMCNRNGLWTSSRQLSAADTTNSDKRGIPLHTRSGSTLHYFSGLIVGPTDACSVSTAAGMARDFRAELRSGGASCI